MHNRELLAKVKQLKTMCAIAKVSDYTTAVMVVDALAEFYSMHAIRLLDIIETQLEQGGTMYICEECGHIFTYPIEYDDRHGLDFPPYEEIRLCPRCKSPGFSSAVNCTNPDCKKLFALGGRTLTKNILCPDCRKNEDECDAD